MYIADTSPKSLLIRIHTWIHMWIPIWIHIWKYPHTNYVNVPGWKEVALPVLEIKGEPASKEGHNESPSQHLPQERGLYPAQARVVGRQYLNIMAGNPPNLMKDMNINIQEAQRISTRMNLKPPIQKLKLWTSSFLKYNFSSWPTNNSPPDGTNIVITALYSLYILIITQQGNQTHCYNHITPLFIQENTLIIYFPSLLLLSTKQTQNHFGNCVL